MRGGIGLGGRFQGPRRGKVALGNRGKRFGRLGARGAIVARVLANPSWRHVFVGDNGNRLQLGVTPVGARR